MQPESRHQCLIYEGSPFERLPFLAGIIQRKLEDGFRCLYMNSEPMVSSMRHALTSVGVDVAAEIAKKRLVLSAEAVTTGAFNSQEMLDKLEAALTEALKEGHKGLWASGDMSWEFGPEKDFSKLMEYELLLEDMFRKRKELCGICQYHLDTLPKMWCVRVYWFIPAS